MPLSEARYLLGALALLAVLGALAWGSRRLRARLVPEWRGTLALAADATIATATLVVTGQLLAALHLLRPGATLVALLGVAAALGAIGVSPSPRAGGQARPVGPTIVLIAFGTAAVVAQWSAHTAVALDGGMTQFDTLWYHGPFSARFLQDATIGSLEGLGTPGSRHYTLDTELLHALTTMPFGRDLLSPLVNLAFLALAGVSAWAIGARRGAGEVSLAGALVALAFPAFVATQPGQASSDVAAAAFLLAAVAMLQSSGLRARPTALAGVAVGLALGAKLTVAPVVGVLTLGVVIVALWRRRAPAALAWCGAAAAVTGAWFIRNWVVVGNPLPWFAVHIGPVDLDASVAEEARPLVESIGDLELWRREYLPELAGSMGRAWPLLVVVLLLVAVLVVRGDGLERASALGVLAAVPAHALMPLTGGVPFGNNLRYLHPALMLGGALVGLVVAALPARARLATVFGLLVLVVAELASPHDARVARWPQEQIPVAIAAGLAVLGLAAVLGRAPARDGASGRRRLAAAVAVLGLVGIGWPVQQHYLRERYVTADLARVDFYAPFRDLSGQRVAVVAAPEMYPFYGNDLSNDVVRLLDSRLGVEEPTCLDWRRELAGYDYVAILPFYVQRATIDPDELLDDPGATVVHRGELGTLYRITGPIDTEHCRDA